MITPLPKKRKKKRSLMKAWLSQAEVQTAFGTKHNFQKSYDRQISAPGSK